MDYQELNQKKISGFIETQLPDFIRSQFTLNNGKTLIQRFIELYYEWMEKEYDLTVVDMSGRTIKEFGSTKIFNTQNEVGNPYNILTKLQSYTDIDRTIYPLLLFLRKQFMVDIPHDIETDLRKTLKLMKHYNVRKGTKKAFEFIFRVLFNKTVDVTKPADFLLKPSSSKWEAPTFMWVQVIGGIEPTAEADLTGFIGYYALGETSGATAKVIFVHSYYIKTTRVTEFLLDEVKDSPAFLNNEYIQAISIIESEGTTTHIPVNKTGTTSQLRVKALAGINKIRWENSGSGHDYEDSIQLSNNGSATGVTGLTGGLSYTVENNNTTTGGSGTGLKVDVLTIDGSGTPQTIQISSAAAGLGYVDNELITITGNSTGNDGSQFRINGVDNQGGASARITRLTRGSVDDVKIDASGQNYEIGDEIYMVGAYLNITETSDTSFIVGDSIIGEDTGATADIIGITSDRVYLDNVVGRFKTDISKNEPYGGENILQTTTEVRATALVADTSYYIKELGEFSNPLPNTVTSSGTGNKTIASTGHSLVADDFVKLPSGTGPSFEIFQVQSVTNANTFVVSSNLTNAISAKVGYKGMTDFTKVGANENKVGVVFIASAAGKGNGLAYPRTKYARVRWHGNIESNTALGVVDSINSTITMGGSGTFTVGEKVTGSSSGAIGTVVSQNGASLVVSRTRRTTHSYTDNSVFLPNTTAFTTSDTITAVSGNNGSGVSRSATTVVNGSIARVRVVYEGYGFSQSPQEYIITTNGSGATLTPYGSKIGGIGSSIVVSPGVSYGTNSTSGSNTKSSPWTTAIGKPNVSVVVDRDGMYVDEKAFLSHGTKTPDKEKIVPFSYKIGTELAYEKWVDIIMKIGAPAGMKIFPEQYLKDTETSTKVISGRITYGSGGATEENI